MQSKMYWSPIITSVLPSAVIPIALAALFNIFIQNKNWSNIPFHALIEGVGSFAAIMLALFILIMRHNKQLNPSYIWIATSLMGMGILDGFHASIEPGVAFVWLHSIATFLGGLTFALIVLPERISALPKFHSVPYFTATLCIFLGGISIFFPELIPNMTIQGQFTTIAELLNIIGGLGFIVAWYHFSWHSKTNDKNEKLLLANHCLLFAMAGLLFHFSSLWDTTWWLWHILRLFAYLVILWFFLNVYNRDVQSFRLAKKVVENTSEAVIITNPDGTIIDINNAYERITGYKREELIGKNPKINKSGRHDKQFYENMWSDIKNKGNWSGEIWDRRKNGKIYPKNLTIDSIQSDNHKVTHYIGVFSDITQKKADEEKLLNLAFYDSLTSLPNRAYFYENINKSILSSQRKGNRKLTALLYIDLDGFKVVNDSMGHSAGDKLLIEIGQRLKECTRKSDMIARIGGDEFGMLVTDYFRSEEIASLANKIIKITNYPIILDSQVVHVGASVG
jgi:diguanylate cyclase (GGDEF)-like protein/PAS domain S-box-containing protein